MARKVTTNLAMLQRLAAPAGKDVLDVGCGAGTLARELADGGARVTGLEISEGQLGDARALSAADEVPVTYLVGHAEDLPLADTTQDIVLFMNSLHHVPEAAMAAALAEACRVLRPGGVVYVAEPLAEGEFYAMVKLVDDEDRVRAAAQATVASAGRAGLGRTITVDYEVAGRLTDLAALRRRMVAVDPARAERFDALETQLAEAFARLGTDRGDAREFTTPVRADVLLRVR